MTDRHASKTVAVSDRVSVYTLPDDRPYQSDV